MLNPTRLMLAVLVLFFCNGAFSQYSIRGKITDSLHASHPLKGATVIVQSLPDSVSRAVFITDEDGLFLLKNLPSGMYRIQVLYISYATYTADIQIDRKTPETSLGAIALLPEANDLGDVTVTQSARNRRAITVKKDTIEFNAASYPVKPDATLADLLRKMPGFTVDRNGDIMAQGEAVQRIMVDGKPFFAGDPKTAALILPPDIIDRIQLVNDKSQKEIFTGFSEGRRTKAINIVTRRKARSMYFGKIDGGAGTNGRYNGIVNVNRFKGSEQVSLTANANNTNQLSYQDKGGNYGDVSVLQGGINYKNTIGSKTDLSGSYQYGEDRTTMETQSLTENIVRDDSSSYNTLNDLSFSRKKTHSVDLVIESRINERTSLALNSRAGFFTNGRQSSNTITTTTGDRNTLKYRSETQYNATESGYHLSGTNLVLLHKFKKENRSLIIDLGFLSSEKDVNGFIRTVNTFFDLPVTTDTINQRVTDKSQITGFKPKISFAEPLGKNSVVEINYVYNVYKDKRQHYAFDLNKATNSYTSFDSLFSTSFENETISNEALLFYRLRNQKYSFNAGGSVQFTNLSSIDGESGKVLKNDFTTLAPTLNIHYSFTPSTSLSVNYNGYNSQPVASQLQPVRYTTDSLNFYTGNPNLRQSFSHSLYAQYFAYNQETRSSFSVSINARQTDNDIRPAITNTANGGRSVTYVNLPGNYEITGYAGYDFPLRKPKSSLALSSSIRFGNSRSLLNDLRNDTRSTMIAGEVTWVSALEKTLDFNLRTGASGHFITNSIQPGENENYYVQSFGADVTYYPLSGWLFNINVDYTRTIKENTNGFNADIALLNFYISRKFLKNNKAEIRLSLYDVLHDNESVTRTITDNLVYDVRTRVPGRYALLSLMYNLRQAIPR